jgi:peptidyl-prolyl cis-trans isomerase A (cyclophilin A)
MKIQTAWLIASALCASSLLPAPQEAHAAPVTQVTLNTSLGNIHVTLLPNDAPASVASFLSYVAQGTYDGSFFHRSVPGFVIQGGGYDVVAGNVSEMSTHAPTADEFKDPNIRGSLALARTPSANSATDQFFFNLADNSGTLSGSNSYSVFGQISDSASLAVMDAIASQKVLDESSGLGAAFSALPVLASANGTPKVTDLVYLNSVDEVVSAGSPDYSIAAAPSQLTLAAGSSGSSTLTLLSLHGYTGTISLSCGPLPASTTCTFQPATVTLAASGSATSTLTISAGAHARLDARQPAGPSGTSLGGPGTSLGGSGTSLSAPGLGIAFGGFAMLALALGVAYRSKARGALVIGLACVGLVAIAAGCGSSNDNGSGPSDAGAADGGAANPFVVPVRLTDGSLSHPIPLQVTLQ